ncbi:MAG: hypothetical protein NC217_06895 [Muribaculaceae bacterium]|nr:hypothetical protein [Muribaculaceae bacterium]
MLIQQAQNAWLNLASERRKRARFKAFTYGRQWNDSCRSTDGRLLTEEQRMVEEGRLPITNNIIRQMVKSIVGRYRWMCEKGHEWEISSDDDKPTEVSFGDNDLAVTDTDARALEEFLISGRVIQRFTDGEYVNVSPDNFFHHPFSRMDGSDCRLMGMLHDMSIAEVFRRFGTGDPSQAAGLKQALRRGLQTGSTWPVTSDTIDFSTPTKPGTYRIIELWRLVAYENLEITDPSTGHSYTDTIDALPRLHGLNKARIEVGSEPLAIRHRAHEQWQCIWLTPAGDKIAVETLPEGKRPPFALCFYPLIDGEVHSLVEDVIDNQKYINRLISLLDHIISSSAKGVLLYPADQLPEGFTWKDVRRIWANPNGILPFKRTAKGMVPQQVNASGTSGAEATRMLQMQLSLFEQISGAAGALSGKSSSAQGENMLRTELENALISMLDILATFRGHILRRENLRVCLIMTDK